MNLLRVYPCTTIQCLFWTVKPSDKRHRYSIASLNVRRNLTYEPSTALPPEKIATLM
ncbi:hypothetical protein M758_1G277100 [Ceratodon purpureus]|uniref:Uncharacterized protein n=1 Tax=Ceratodon purpureus TaxID=3225 RepID=A0A8T0JDG0_CERPU|nr:hypothetical protein KC19_1G285500 [Ceratodon purpureus]KAG0631754.1 hypothetical protein M758_1G277100 [Ceratodon purpureus]